MSKTDMYVVWRRSDGYVDASTYMPRDQWLQFEELLRTEDWSAAHSRIRAERTAAVMNEDLWPIAETARSNRRGVQL